MSTADLDSHQLYQVICNNIAANLLDDDGVLVPAARNVFESLLTMQIPNTSALFERFHKAGWSEIFKRQGEDIKEAYFDADASKVT